jgi:hypothetical protein
MADASTTLFVTTRDNVRPDPLAQAAITPDRLAYGIGMLLDAKDFEDEQTYHRGRLARALWYLHGSGTIAGLRVVWEPAASAGGSDELHVEPGIAIDRVGRLVEVPRRACLRLTRWFDAQIESALIESMRNSFSFTPDVVQRGTDGRITNIAGGTASVTLAAVVADVYLRYTACERGRTPAIATGPFDALDAVQPSRLRDGYALELVPRRGTLDLPDPRYPLVDEGSADTRARRLRDAALGAWRENQWTSRGLPPEAGQLAGQDPTSLFLARIAIPATRTGTARPVRTAAQEVRVDNHTRAFTYAADALARLLVEL